MRWLEWVHILTAMLWIAAASRLPIEMARAIAGGPRADEARRRVRTVFFGVSTPLAVLTVASGTSLFGQQASLAPWPLINLVVVGLLVWSHGACGLLVLKLERHQHRGLLNASRILTTLTVVLLLLFVVLAKFDLPLE